MHLPPPPLPAQPRNHPALPPGSEPQSLLASPRFRFRRPVKLQSCSSWPLSLHQLPIMFSTLELVQRINVCQRAGHDNVRVRALPRHSKAAVLNDARNFSLGIGSARDRAYRITNQLGLRTRDLGNHFVTRVHGAVARGVVHLLLTVD